MVVITSGLIAERCPETASDRESILLGMATCFPFFWVWCFIVVPT